MEKYGPYTEWEWGPSGKGHGKGCQIFQAPENNGKVWSKEGFKEEEGDQTREQKTHWTCTSHQLH